MAIVDIPGAGQQLLVTTGKPGAATTILVNGAADTGYRLLGSPDWGNAEFDRSYSGPQGTQGARLAGRTPQNRIIAFSFRIVGSTKDDLFAKLSTLNVLADELDRFGGTITWKALNQTFRQHFNVLSGSAKLLEWRKRADHSNIAEVTLGAVCAPYLLGDVRV